MFIHTTVRLWYLETGLSHVGSNDASFIRHIMLEINVFRTLTLTCIAILKKSVNIIITMIVSFQKEVNFPRTLNFDIVFGLFCFVLFYFIFR